MQIAFREQNILLNQTEIMNGWILFARKIDW